MAQVAVSVVLLVGAGLLLLSFYRLQSVDPGYRGDRVMSAEVFGNFTKYPDAQSLRRLYVSMLERLESCAGCRRRPRSPMRVPLAGLQPGQTRFQIQGKTYDTPDERPTADVRVASTEILRHARAFRSGAVAASPSSITRTRPPVAIINETMVRQWEGRDPIGTEVSFDNGQNWVDRRRHRRRRQDVRPRPRRGGADLPCRCGRRADSPAACWCA